jgi:AbiV family abortive infection protein
MHLEGLRDTVKSVIENAERLFDDAKLLEGMERFPSAYAISILAQEEFGKAFLLHLAAEQRVPWTPGLQRALRNHQCKQLVALVMEYIQRKDFLELLQEPDRFRGASSLPAHVMDAIHIVVHEHIRELDRAAWVDEGERKVHPIANRIAHGILDREKQSGIYIHVGWNGTIRKAPHMVTAQRCQEEIARTERVGSVFWTSDGRVQAAASFDLPKIMALFEALSGLMTVEEFNERWWR